MAVDVVGGGPAGAMAAMAALREGAQVRVFEQSVFPRQKVCGEFLSPEVFDVLGRTGCAGDFLRLGPAVLRRMVLHFGDRAVRRPLPESAYGLSRYELDRLLLDRAAGMGAVVVRERWTGASPAARDVSIVLAAGRKAMAPAGARLFGFKAHFRGPADDAVELHFFDTCYVGVSAVENQETNVCGLAPEQALRAHGFRPDELMLRSGPLAERLRPMTRITEWKLTGPLVFSNRLNQPAEEHTYRAGDALGFIDPFTGSGILNAMLTGRLAGWAAAKGTPPEAYLRECRRLLRRPFLVSTALRAAIASGHAGLLASVVPGGWLFHGTRPSWRSVSA